MPIQAGTSTWPEIQRAYADGEISFNQALEAAIAVGRGREVTRISLAQIRQPEEGGGAPGDGGDNPQQGDPLTADQILAALQGGAIEPQEAIDQLVALGGFWNTTTATNTVNSTVGQGTVQNPVDLESGGDALGPPLEGSLGEQRGFPEVSRRLALQSGVAPEFRSLLQSRIGRQTLPFSLALAKGTFQGDSDLSFDEQLQSPSGFERFINERGGGGFGAASGIGRNVGQALSFVRNPSEGDEFSAEQAFIRSQLQGPEGSVGLERFNPLINELTQSTGRRFLPGVGNAARSALSSTLQNTVSRTPGRFPTLSSFEDFLRQQGLVTG